MPTKGTLWVGGTSGLAHTFLEEVGTSPRIGGKFVLAGCERPAWKIPDTCSFVEVDMFDASSVASLMSRLPHEVDTLIFGVRLSLIWGGDHHLKLSQNLEALVLTAASAGVTRVLHISSVAVADHLRAQIMVKESDPLPPIEEYKGPYDLFKRASEEIIGRVCSERGLSYCHLRLSGIYSNDKGCIQVSSMSLQCPIAAYIPTALDMNSSKNVANAIDLIITRFVTRPDSVAKVYYYTRGAGPPVPYGKQVVDYRAAHNVWYALWIPFWAMKMVLLLVHCLSAVFKSQVLKSISYLAGVCQLEHSFDNTLFRKDFPEIAEYEETMLEAFVRIRWRRKYCMNHVADHDPKLLRLFLFGSVSN